MSCALITLTPVRVGDTWDGLTGTPSSVDTDIEDPLARVRMTFTLAGASTPALTLDSNTEGQATFDADTWEFAFLARTPIGLTAGFYSWAIEFTDDADRVQTPRTATGTIEILADT